MAEEHDDIEPEETPNTDDSEVEEPEQDTEADSPEAEDAEADDDADVEDEEDAEEDAEDEDDADSDEDADDEADDEEDEYAALSEEEVDEIADTAIDILCKILKYFDVEDAEINEYEGEDGQLILDVVGGDLAVLIGRHGRNLAALQTVMSSILYRKLKFHYPVTIDVESYKYRQNQKITKMAHSAANKAYKTDREVRMRIMNPYERRIVHMALRDDSRVETRSEGEDPERFVIVRPI
ncbi:MAG: KH domain-containing protein [Coriobacteriaceae bacterium]|nr:KH domain-containing protein [Coriobacteriaceae bacterium]